MAEYISREAVNNLIEDMQNNRLLLVCERTNLYILKSKVAELPAADVQPVSVIKELQEHIKQRILETAFNNGGIYGEVAEDIANRIDIWVDEFRRNKNA